MQKPIILLIRPGRRLRPSGPIPVLPLAVLLLVTLAVLFRQSLYHSVLGPLNNPLFGKTIVIDPGHGGTDPGAMYKGIL